MTSYGSFTGVGGELFVHPEHAKFIVGKGGSTIRKIQSETNCRVMCDETTKGGCVTRFTIGGRSTGDVEDAMRRLMVVAKHAEHTMPRVRGMSGFEPTFATYSISGVEGRCVVSMDDVGMVMGAKGATIRRIGCDSQCNIKFYKSDTKSNGQPCFSVRGFLRSDVDMAVKKIYAIAQESYMRRTGDGVAHPRRSTMAVDGVSRCELAGLVREAEGKRVSFDDTSSSTGSTKRRLRSPSPSPLPRTPSPSYTASWESPDYAPPKSSRTPSPDVDVEAVPPHCVKWTAPKSPSPETTQRRAARQWRRRGCT
jgi:hypothetical protein